MRDSHEPTLVANGGDCLTRGEAGGDGALKEEGDQIPLGGAHLGANDHGQPWGGGIAGAQGAVNAVVVGDGEVGDAP